MPSLLDDVVVLDLTRFLSGPYATLLLAGMGAEVIKIDDPASGDPTVNSPPFARRDGVAWSRSDEGDLGLAYLKRARGKRSTTLNLKSERGRALFLDLVEMVLVDVRVAKGVDELTRPIAGLDSDHLEQQRVARDIKRHTQEQIGRALIELQAESAL